MANVVNLIHENYKIHIPVLENWGAKEFSVLPCPEKGIEHIVDAICLDFSRVF